MAEYIWILKNKAAALFSNPQWRARRRCVWFSASSWELYPQAGLSRNDLDFEGNVQSSNRHSSTILHNYAQLLWSWKNCLEWIEEQGKEFQTPVTFTSSNMILKKHLSSLLVMTKSSIYDKEAKKNLFCSDIAPIASCLLQPLFRQRCPSTLGSTLKTDLMTSLTWLWLWLLEVQTK